MHIAFDGTTLRPGRTGVGYYTEHLLRHAAEQCVEDEISVISNVAIETTEPLPARVRRVVAPSWSPRLLWMQTQAPRLLRRLGADVVHFTNGMLLLARVCWTSGAVQAATIPRCWQPVIRSLRSTFLRRWSAVRSVGRKRLPVRAGLRSIADRSIS